MNCRLRSEACQSRLQGEVHEIHRMSDKRQHHAVTFLPMGLSVSFRLSVTNGWHLVLPGQIEVVLFEPEEINLGFDMAVGEDGIGTAADVFAVLGAGVTESGLQMVSPALGIRLEPFEGSLE